MQYFFSWLSNAPFKREYILDRQREGIEIARQNEKNKGRKPVAVDGEKFAEVYARWKAGEIHGVSAMRELGLSSWTFYRWVRAYENSLK